MPVPCLEWGVFFVLLAVLSFMHELMSFFTGHVTVTRNANRDRFSGAGNGLRDPLPKYLGLVPTPTIFPFFRVFTPLFDTI